MLVYFTVMKEEENTSGEWQLIDGGIGLVFVGSFYTLGLWIVLDSNEDQIVFAFPTEFNMNLIFCKNRTQ